MNSAILTTNSDKDLTLILEVAKKLGIKTKVLSEEQKEDFGMIQAIKQGKTNEFVDTDKFIQKLKK